MPIDILMPALSPTMEEGTLAKWLVKEGDTIEPGDVIAEIETDKATMEVEAVDEGTVGKILVGEGTENVPVNNVIAVILQDGEDSNSIGNAPATPAPQPPKEAEPVAAEVTPEPSAAVPQQAVSKSSGGRIFASPLARRIAAQNNVPLDALSGSGPHGRIVKRDVEAAIVSGVSAAPAETKDKAAPSPSTKQPSLAPSAGALPDARAFFDPDAFEEIPHDQMRKTIARRLTAAKQGMPHFRLNIACEIDKLLAMRKELNGKSPEGDGAFKISVNDMIIKALALALLRIPAANASWTDDAMLRHKHADIGVAVAIDGGLITPIVRQADTKGLATIANEMKDLALRARERKLKPHEFEGGSFAVSNLGMFGIDHFDAVINPPHAGILAIGAGAQKPVVKDGALSIATVMNVTLSCDHRVIDGALGAQLLEVFKGYVEDPSTMLL